MSSCQSCMPNTPSPMRQRLESNLGDHPPPPPRPRHPPDDTKSCCPYDAVPSFPETYGFAQLPTPPKPDSEYTLASGLVTDLEVQ